MAGKWHYGPHDFFRHAEPMMRGVEQVADVAKAAYGPRGRMVEIHPGSGPRYTKRGNMIIDFVFLADPLEARGGEMLKLAAGSSFGQPDDGAITTAILGDFMLRHGEMAVAAGTDPFDLQIGIDLAVQTATAHLRRQAQRTAGLAQSISVATIAADNDEELGNTIGRMIAGGVDPAEISVIGGPHQGVAIRDATTFYVGPTSTVDYQERLLRARTALRSLQAAQAEGVVVGGGAALMRAANALDDVTVVTPGQWAGVDIVRQALQQPARQLAISARADPDAIAGAITAASDPHVGFNSMTGQVGDLYDAGIIDPLNVVRNSLSRAGDVARGFIAAADAVRSGPEWVAAYCRSNPTFAPVLPEMFEAAALTSAPEPLEPPSRPLPAGRRPSGKEDLGENAAPSSPETGTADPFADPFADPVGDLPMAPPMGSPDIMRILEGSDGAFGAGGTSPAEDEPPGPQQPDRYLVGNFPEQVRRDSVAELTVRVSLTEAPGRSDKLDLAIPPEGITLDIVVVAKAFTFEGPAQASLYVPPASDSALVGFRLRAVEDGITQVHVSAFHRGSKVADLTLRATIGNAATDDPPPRTVTRAIPKVEPRPGEVSLFVIFHKPSNTYQFLWEDDDGWQAPVYSEKVFVDLTTAITQTAARIDEIARLDYSVDQESAKRMLKTHGIALWNLLPEKLRDRFILCRDRIRRITIYSDDDPFPWEMLYPFRHAPLFDADRFLVEQVEICHWVHGSKPPNVIPVRRVDFVVAAASLEKAKTEVAKVTELLKKWDEALQENQIETANQLYKLFEQAMVSLLHFACHQSFDGNIERITIGNVPVAPENFIDCHLLAEATAFIFMNACRSDRRVPGYTKMGGWANTFLGAGAGAFVGTLWEVRDETAALFAETLYEQLFAADEPKPFGEALNCARSRVKELAPGDPTWLAYSFYGDAEARVRKIAG